MMKAWTPQKRGWLISRVTGSSGSGAVSGPQCGITLVGNRQGVNESFRIPKAATGAAATCRAGKDLCLQQHKYILWRSASPSRRASCVANVELPFSYWIQDSCGLGHNPSLSLTLICRELV